MSERWKRHVERETVLAGNEPPRPVWNRNIPRCHEACAYHDGKRCQLIGLRAPETCEPVAETLGGLVQEHFGAIQQALSEKSRG
jgi:hypothetical protein